jgi:endopeptidase La
MTVLHINKLLLRFLKNGYIRRTNIVKNVVDNIDYMNSLLIINNHERNLYLKNLNNIVKLLSLFYNKKYSYINKTPDSNQDNVSEEVFEKIEINNLISEEEKNTSSLDLELKLLKYDIDNKVTQTINNTIDFGEIDEKIKKFILCNGLGNIKDIIEIICNYDYDILIKNKKNKDLLNILIDTFIPFSVSVKQEKIKEEKIEIEKKDSSVSVKTEIFLENFYSVILFIKIKFFQTKIIIEGFFKNDQLNMLIRTSNINIASKIIAEKRKQIYDIYFQEKEKQNINTNKKNRNEKKIMFIPDNFKEMHLKNLTLGDILVSDKNALINKLNDDYITYQKYSTITTFTPLFGDFINANLKEKFNIIRCLLLSQNGTNNAGLLFSFTNESKIGSSIISDIIYRNLNLSSQLKLHRANKSLKHEIEKLNNMTTDDIDLKKQIGLNRNIPIRIKKLAFEKLEEMKSGGSEYYKQLKYVKILVEYPWIGNDNNDGDIFSNYQHDEEKWIEIMKSAHDELNNKVFGHNECKETIVELLGKWFRNPKSLGKAIGLYGPPGVGKTLIAKALGNALGLPFTQINLGGMEDGAILTGHSITYSGAVPGLIVTKMVEAGKPRCIMFFDELDKASFRHGRNEIYDILIHVTDPNSNSEFNDKFFQDVRFPINKVLFVFSFNDRKKIEKILLDRMEIIKVGAYTLEDKINITKNFLMKELITDIGIKKPEISITDDCISRIVESFTAEAGVRELKRCIEKIICKLNKDLIFKTEPFNNNVDKVIIDDKMIDKYLQRKEIIIKKIHNNPEIGTVNGLYATELGSGGIIPILVYKRYMGLKNNFILELTGKQGDTMRESVKFAFNISTNLIKQQYVNKFFSEYKTGLHIHTPDGATQKDGPSAGCAFTLAFISRILNKKIKNEIGMTGEIDRNGNISAIGGLEYKLAGAKRAGIKLVLIPNENKKDLETIIKTNKNLICDTFKVICVNHITEILDYALIENKNKGIYKKCFNHKKYLLTELESENEKKNKIKIDVKYSNNISSESSESSIEELSENENQSEKEISSEYNTEDMDY